MSPSPRFPSFNIFPLSVSPSLCLSLSSSPFSLPSNTSFLNYLRSNYQCDAPPLLYTPVCISSKKRHSLNDHNTVINIKIWTLIRHHSPNQKPHSISPRVPKMSPFPFWFKTQSRIMPYTSCPSIRKLQLFFASCVLDNLESSIFHSVVSPVFHHDQSQAMHPWPGGSGMRPGPSWSTASWAHWDFKFHL